VGTSPGRQTGALTLRRPASRRRSLPHKARFYSALGVVYGDIGTSPPYTFKTAHEAAGGAWVDVALGLLSLITWTLIIGTSVKYVALVMVARFLCIAALGFVAIFFPSSCATGSESTRICPLCWRTVAPTVRDLT